MILLRYGRAPLSRIVPLLLALILLDVLPNDLAADTFDWNNAGGGDVSVASNWTLTSGASSAPPSVGDEAVFNLPNTYTTTMGAGFGTGWSLDRVLVTGGVVTLDNLGGISGVAGNLNLLNGAADLEIDGGQLILTGSVADLNVNVGDDLIVREGILEIRNQATVTAPTLILGQQGGLTSEVHITSGDLQITNSGNNNIGLNAAVGILDISGGSATLAGATRLGVSGALASSGTIQASGGLLTLDTLLLGGTAGTGSLNISGNGSVQQTGASTMAVGGTGGAGSIDISGTGSLDTGTGTITINSTGDVNISGGTFQADGFLDFQGGQLDLSGGELIINAGMDAITSGTLNMTGGKLRVAGGLARISVALNYGGPSDLERAEVIVESGQTAEMQFAMRIGSSAGTFGKAVVSGVTSGVRSTLRGTNGGAGADLVVGDAGDGELEALNGALVSFRDDVFIANQFGSEGSVLVSGVSGGFRATLDATIGGSGAVLSVAPSGTGSLTVENGALVQVGADVFLASTVNGNATVTVGGNSGGFDATLQSGDDIFVGGGGSAGGTAALSVNAGGSVIAPDLLRVYGGGTLNLSGGRVEVGSIDFQGGSTLNFVNGTLAFSGDAIIDNILANQILPTGMIDAGQTVAVGGLLTLPNQLTIDGGELQIFDVNDINQIDFQSGTLTLTMPNLSIGTGGLLGSAPTVIAGQTLNNLNDSVVDATGAINVSGGNFISHGTLTVQSGGVVAVSSGALVSGGLLSVQSGGQINVAAAGSITVPDSSSTVQLAGLFNNDGSIDAIGGTIEIVGSATISGTGQVGNGTLRGAGVGDTLDLGSNTLAPTLTIENLQVSNANFTTAGSYSLADGARLASATVQTPVTVTGSDVQFSGTLDNQATVVIADTLTVPSTGLTLTGGGVLFGSGRLIPNFPLPIFVRARLVGEPGAVLTNQNNLIDATENLFPVVEAGLDIENLVVDNSAGGTIGRDIRLLDVDLIGGGIPGDLVTIQNNSTLDGDVSLTGGLSALDATIVPTGQLTVESGGALTIDDVSFQVRGTLRQEPGGTITVTTPGTYDWVGGSLELVDDQHSVDLGATISASSVTYGTLNHDAGSTGFMRAVFGGSASVATGQQLSVSGVATLNDTLRVDGGTFTAGFLTNYANLDLRSGEFHLTQDDFNVGAGEAGPVFTVSSGATLTVDKLTNIAIGNRLVVPGGVVNGNTLSNGGDFDLIDGQATFTGAANNSGDLNAIDSTLTFSAGLTNTGQLNLINSTVNGAISSSGSAALSGVNTFTGDVSGNGGFTGGGTVVFEALYAPGASPATVTIEGTAQFGTGSTLEIELGGLTPGSEHDRLEIGIAATLDGTLDVLLINGFVPALGDTFEIITAAGGVTGIFSAESFPDLGPLLVLQTFQDANNVAIAVVPALSGDYNADGAVDAADYTVWRDSEGQTGVGLAADGNGDGAVNAADYTVWTSQFGQVTLPSQAIPEPSAMVLIFCSILNGCFIGLRR